MRGARRARGLVVLTIAAAPAAGGCLRPVLTANDVVVRPDGTVQLTAFAENATLPGVHNSLRNLRVRFFCGQTRLGEARSGEEGCTTLNCHLPPKATTYAARARFWMTRLESTGRVFRWTADRTILVVDIDDTVCDTDEEEVIFQKRDLESSPIHHAQPTLARLSASFHIAYLTARPEALFVKTVRWLDDHRFPPGPVFTAPSLGQMIRKTRYKTETLRRLRADWPNIRVGVGDSPADAQACGANHMLALIVAEAPEGDYGPRAIVLRDWAAVDAFFRHNHAALADPHRLGKTVDGGGSFVVPHRPRGGD